MTGEATRRDRPERRESVVELIAAMRRISGLLESPLGTGANGLPSELGEVCFDHLKAAAADLADTEPVTLDDLAALTAYAQVHCVVGAQASRDFDPVIASRHLEIAVALLGKAVAKLQTMTGLDPADFGLGQRLN